jgi:hypothetical protein
MTSAHSLSEWYFSGAADHSSPIRTILWWEYRRVPFNLLVGSIAVVSLLLTLLLVDYSKLTPGEDVFEPFTLFLAPVILNVAYTAGWVVEIIFGRVWSEDGRPVGPRLLKAGTTLSLLLVAAPPILWGGIRLLQLL